MKSPLYVCGPMTGLPDYNYPAFNDAAATLRAMGYTVLNPAENPAQDTWEAYMRQAIAQLVQCQTIVLLPGWTDSRGALIEYRLALELGIKPVLFADVAQELQALCN